MFIKISSFVFSQHDSSSFNVITDNYFHFNYENDFFSATDRYYTQGVSAQLIHPVIRHSPISKVLIKLKGPVTNYYGLQIKQDCFTPKSIRIDTIMFGERPYAGTFLVSHSLSSLNKQQNLLLHTQFDFGIIGNYAMCEEEQKAIHKALDNIEPLSWEYQLANEFVINYRGKVEKGIFSNRHFDLTGNANAKVGTLYTDVGTGINLRFGFFDPYFNNLGLSKDPSSRKFKVFGVIKANAKLVGYNAALQGGVFSKDIYVIDANNLSRFVFDGTAAITIAYKTFSLTYSQTYITREYHTGVDHSWGGIFITKAF